MPCESGTATGCDFDAGVASDWTGEALSLDRTGTALLSPQHPPRPAEGGCRFIAGWHPCSDVGLVVQPADPRNVRIDRDDWEQCEEILYVLTLRGFGDTSDTFAFQGVGLRPSDLTYAPTQQLIHPSIEDRLEISQVTLAALLGGCGCS